MTAVPRAPGDGGSGSGFGPLAGVRILDLSRVLAGPFCTAMLADLGAEVIKVEVPGRGDDARAFGPFRNGESLYFAQLNRQKKSVTLNLRVPDGREVLHGLARRCDVLVENFRPGVTGRLQISYEDLRPQAPSLVYVSISGFGQDGPFAERPAYDHIVQAASGLMAVTGFPDGQPTRVGESFGDICAGLWAAWATCAALFERERTGRGRRLDVSMFESLLATQVTPLSQYQATGQPPGRVGNRHPLSTPFDAYRAADGLVVIAAGNDELFERLAGLIGRPGLSGEPRFSSDEERTRHEPELRGIIESFTSVRRVDEVVSLTTAAGIPCSPVWDIAQALSSEQAVHRRIVSYLEHPRAGRVAVVRQPVRFDDERNVGETPSPALGQHTDEVLSELLHLSPGELGRLRERGIT
ncbi:MAG: CaiB/BaiF CoA transferase family protein [Acidimicrobiales bacterium]